MMHLVLCKEDVRFVPSEGRVRRATVGLQFDVCSRFGAFDLVLASKSSRVGSVVVGMSHTRAIGALIVGPVWPVAPNGRRIPGRRCINSISVCESVNSMCCSIWYMLNSTDPGFPYQLRPMRMDA
eukprot:11166413-Lingulodinium_polyedra.AAC.1